MRFSLFGGMIQSCAGTEGDVLRRAGYLVEARERGYVIGFDPTGKLSDLFDSPVDLEAIYPLLVEMVCYYRIPTPDFVNHGQLCRQLKMRGMTKQGLERFERRVEEIVGPRMDRPQGTWEG